MLKKVFGTIGNGSGSIWVFHGDRWGTPQSVEVCIGTNRLLRGTRGVSQRVIPGTKIFTNTDIRLSRFQP